MAKLLNCWQHSCHNTRKLCYFIKASREEDGCLINALGSPLWSSIHYIGSHDRVKQAHHFVQHFQHVIFSPFLGRGIGARTFRDTLWYMLAVVLNVLHIKLLLFSATTETFLIVVGFPECFLLQSRCAQGLANNVAGFLSDTSTAAFQHDRWDRVEIVCIGWHYGSHKTLKATVKWSFYSF